jgi:hypothetical protein
MEQRDPDWKQDEVKSSTRPFSIPLKRDRKFDMRYPANLTKHDFDTIVKIMGNFKPLIVAVDEPAKNAK